MKEQAEIYRIGLMLGLFKISDVISWCDSVIMSEASPNIAIIEASLSGSRGAYAVAKDLAEVTGEFSHRAVVKGLFLPMYDLVNQDRKRAPQVARWLYQMAMDNDVPDDEAESDMWYFWDAVDLAVEGIHGDEEEVVNELLHFLKAHSGITQ